MESEKQVMSSEASSEENDQIDHQSKAESTPKRSYECTYCKRGFTNAQALGGHMNIHRKDRTKNKQQQSASNPNTMASRSYVGVISSEQENYVSSFEAQVNYPMKFQPQLASNPRPDFYGTNSQSLNMKEELCGSNLSLKIGPWDTEEKEMKREDEREEEELDLELRLGHNP